MPTRADARCVGALSRARINLKNLLITVAIIVVVVVVVILGSVVAQTWTAELTREFLPQVFKMVETIVGIVALLAFGPKWIGAIAALRKPKEEEHGQPAQVQSNVITPPPNTWSGVEYVEYGTRK